jgi:ADP-heptose:LPS heptosyltransferase
MKRELLNIAYKLFKLKEDFLAKVFLESYEPQRSQKRKLLIVKTDAIGDYILFRNFIKSIKESKKYKNHEIHLLGNVVWKDLFENLDEKYIKKAVFINLKEIYYQGNKYRQEIIKKLSKDDFDTVIYPAHSRNSIIDILISKIKAKTKISFLGDTDNMSYLEKPFTDKVYTKLIKTKERFEFNRNKDFFEQVIEDKIKIQNPKINIKKKQGNYFVVNPGASVRFKQWPPENFAKVIDYLIEKYKARIYIVGSKAELGLDNKVRDLSRHKDKIEIKNGGSLFDLLKLIAGSRGVISNETCTPHMAVALGKRVYCITGKLGHVRMHPYPNYKNATYHYPYNLSQINESKHWHKNFIKLNTIKPKEVIQKLNF